MADVTEKFEFKNIDNIAEEAIEFLKKIENSGLYQEETTNVTD